MDRYDWIIGICSSAGDGVVILRFTGTKNEVKKKLIKLIKEDKKCDKENWDSGSETVGEIMDNSGGLGYEFYGYGCYYDYHIDYTAKELSRVEFV